MLASENNDFGGHACPPIHSGYVWTPYCGEEMLAKRRTDP